MFSKSKRSPVGLDIGARNVKGAILVKSGKRIILEKYVFHDLALNNELYPHESELVKSFSAIVDAQGLANARVVTCIPDAEVFTQDLTLPMMPEPDLELAIKNAVEEQLNLTPQDSVFRKQKLGPAMSDEIKDGHLIKVYCARKASIENVKNILGQVKLEAANIGPGVLALSAMLAHNDYLDDAKSQVLVDLGENHTTLILFSGTKVIGTQVVAKGLGHINQTLFEAEGVAYDISEQLKTSYDLNAQENATAEENHKHIDESLGDLLYKMQRIVSAFRLRLKGAPVNNILVTGGGSNLLHVTAALETYCGAPAILVNPFKNIDLYEGEMANDQKIAGLAPYMGLAIGLALVGLAKEADQINFIGEVAVKKSRLPAVNVEAIVACTLAGVFLVAATITGLKFKAVQSKESELAMVTTDLASKRAQTAALKVETGGDVGAKRMSLVKSLSERKVHFSDLLKEISLLTPHDVWLTSFKVTPEKEGTAISVTAETPATKQMGDYLRSLENSFYFRDARFKYSEQLAGGRQNFYRFQFDTLLKEGEIAR